MTAAEATWLFKVAENDLSLRDTDKTPLLFQRMFPDSAVANKFAMSRQKASYTVADGIGPFLEKKIIEDVSKSDGCFTLMYDETTTAQNKKQMDLLFRYWSNEENKVVTKYFSSFFLVEPKPMK